MLFRSEIDKKSGKFRLSMRALQEKPEGYVEEQRQRRDRGPRREGGNNGRRDNNRGPRREGGHGPRREGNRGPRREGGNEAPAAQQEAQPTEE